MRSSRFTKGHEGVGEWDTLLPSHSRRAICVIARIVGLSSLQLQGPCVLHKDHGFHVSFVVTFVFDPGGVRPHKTASSVLKSSLNACTHQSEH